MQYIPASELILNQDGTIYHLNLHPEDIADTIITVGDPGRVHKITQYFDDIEFEMNKREFITQTGLCNGKRITVISSGMGTDNVEILLTELDALVNIDLEARVPKDLHRQLRIIRIGTSGSLQEHIPVDSLLASVTAIGLDTLMSFYNLPQSGQEQRLAIQIGKELQLGFIPYCINGSENLLREIGSDMTPGVTITCPGFYAPQGRRLRVPLQIPDLVKRLNQFRYEETLLTNFEMETAGYYALGKLLNHQVISLNAVVANRITNVFSKDAEKTIDKLIRTVLERL
jgi:uridine phosphorylase